MAAETSAWTSFYKEGATLETFFGTLAHHEPLMRALLADRPGTALEAGSGPAIMSSFLQMAGIQTVAVDNDPGVLQVARESAARWAVQPEFVEGDIFELEALGRSVDVVFSQGVLEHFDDAQIRKATEQALVVAPKFVFSVPSKWYGHKDYGNERLMLAPEWESILKGLGKVTTEPYFFARRRYTYALKKPLMVLVTVERS